MKLTKMRGKFLRRHGGTILAVVASVGVVATAIETGRATTKAKHLLEVDEALRKSLSLDGDVSRNLANKIDAEVQLQNGLKSAGNEDTLRAINALAGHMDGVAESIKGMSVTINGRKAIGYIDDRMGRLTAAKVK